jgi:hypothetical protein
MKILLLSVFVGVALVVLLLGCMRGTPINPYPVTGATLNKISLKMTKAEVEISIGRPDAVRGSILNRYGQAINVWEYMLVESPNALTPGTIT